MQLLQDAILTSPIIYWVWAGFVACFFVASFGSFLVFKIPPEMEASVREKIWLRGVGALLFILWIGPNFLQLLFYYHLIKK